MFKVNNRNTRTRCEICSKLIKKTAERRHWRCSNVFIVNFEHISHLALVFLLLNLSRLIPAELLICFFILINITVQSEIIALNALRKREIVDTQLILTYSE